MLSLADHEWFHHETKSKVANHQHPATFLDKLKMLHRWVPNFQASSSTSRAGPPRDISSSGLHSGLRSGPKATDGFKEILISMESTTKPTSNAKNSLYV